MEKHKIAIYDPDFYLDEEIRYMETSCGADAVKKLNELFTSVDKDSNITFAGPVFDDDYNASWAIIEKIDNRLVLTHNIILKIHPETK